MNNYLKIVKKNLLYHWLLIFSINPILASIDIENSRLKNLYLSIDYDSLYNHSLIRAYQDKNDFSMIRINPSLKLTQHIPDLRKKLMLFGKTENYHFYIESIITNDFYKNYVLGSSYSRSNLSGRINNAFIKMYNQYISFQFGRSPVSWGTGSISSIIKSGSLITFDHIMLQLDLSEFFYESMTGQLGSEKTIDGRKIKRYISGHRLNWKVSKIFQLGFGEMIIYTGINRGLDLTYLNPFVPYFFSALEGDEQTEPYDNDNSILFLYGNYRSKGNAFIFMEMIIDEYQVDETGVDNALGVKIGFRNEKLIFNKKISSTLEWTKIDPWTYIHHGQFTSWQNKGHSLGFDYGPNSECFEFKIIFDLLDDLYVRGVIKFLKKGPTFLNTEWNNVAGYELDNSLDKYTFYDLSIIKKNKDTIIEAGLSLMPFSNTIAFESRKFPISSSTFIKLSYSIDKIFLFN